jgi:hypothetical protein
MEGSFFQEEAFFDAQPERRNMIPVISQHMALTKTDMGEF